MRKFPKRPGHLAMLLLATVLAHPLARPAFAQDRVTLTLEEALALARRENPEFRIQSNDETTADWRVREAYAGLLPTSSASARLGYQGEGQPLVDPAFRGLGISRVPEYYSSSYSLGINYELSADRLLRPARERAHRRATVAGIEAAERQLELDVTRQYLAALRAQEGVALARGNLSSARENEELARARARVGAGTELDVKQAEVRRGRAEVALLEAEHAVRTERLRLMEFLGVQVDGEVVLTSGFVVFEPRWEVDDLIAEALSSHPRLRALEATEAAERANQRAARGSMLPSLSLYLGWSGFTQQVGNTDFLVGQARNQAETQVADCQFWHHISAGLSNPIPDLPSDCGQFRLTPEQERNLIAANDVFPLDFTRQPLVAQIQLSVPIFSGLQRRRQAAEAAVAADNARHRRRAEELARRTVVAEALHGLETAYRRVQLEERNAGTAAEQLELARQRYRLGAGDFIEVAQAEADKAQADHDHLGAVFAFHEAITALEAAVGRTLREAGGAESSRR